MKKECCEYRIIRRKRKEKKWHGKKEKDCEEEKNGQNKS